MNVLSVLVEITIYSTIIFCVIMLVKWLLKGRMSPLLHYAIWGIFILRLLLPVTLQSPIQPFSLPKTQPAVTVPVLQQANAPSLAGQENPEAAAPVATDLKDADTLTPPGQIAPQPVDGLMFPLNRKPVIETVLLAVWLTGAGIGIGYLILLYVRLRKQIVKNAVQPSKRLRAIYKETKGELGIRKKVPLTCLYGLDSPGLLFPAQVLMPMEALAAMDDGQVKQVLTHELIHYRRKDQVVCILLSVLNAVYWFHPVVWLAVKRIRADMETACDSAVVRHMNATQKGNYAQLILELFSRSRCQRVVLGMANGNTITMAEQRIKGVFMNHASKWTAKAVCALMVLVLAAGCFTTACVPVEKDAALPAAITTDAANPSTTPQDNAGASQEAVLRPLVMQEPTGAASPLFEKLGAPQHWNYDETSSDGRLRVLGNLDITLPNVEQIAVASAEFRKFTEADLLRVTDVIFGNDAKFIYATQDTKEWAEAFAARLKKFVDELDAGTGTNKSPSWEKSVRNQYEYYLERAKTAPSAAERKEIPPVFTERINATGDSILGFCGMVTRDGIDYLVSITEPSQSSVNWLSIGEAYEDRSLYYQGTFRSVPEGVRLTREQAIEQANAVAAQMTDELSLCHVMTVGLPENMKSQQGQWAWKCVYMRQINGCGTVYSSEDVSSDIARETGGRGNETLEITINDRGVCQVYWANPMTVKETTVPDAPLLSFDAVVEPLIEQLREKYDYEITRKDGMLTLYLQHVELGYMRIGKPDSEVYQFEPVWSFFIDFEENRDYSKYPDLLRAVYSGDPAYWNAITVSAIDGRIIDRNYGA